MFETNVYKQYDQMKKEYDLILSESGNIITNDNLDKHDEYLSRLTDAYYKLYQAEIDIRDYEERLEEDLCM